MPRGMANLLEVVVFASGSHALLRRRGAAAMLGILLREEDPLELDHSRVGEEERGVVARDQRRAGKDGMTMPFEEGEESLTDLGSAHSATIYRRPRAYQTGAGRLFERE